MKIFAEECFGASGTHQLLRSQTFCFNSLPGRKCATPWSRMTTESPVLGFLALRPLRVRISNVPSPRSSMILSAEQAGLDLVEEQIDDPVDILLARLDQG